MTYVEGRFSDRRSKRAALMVLTLAFGLSCARGIVGSFPRDDDGAVLAPEPGVAMAVPLKDLPPEPVLQAEQTAPAKVRAAVRPRREKPPEAVELAASAEAAVTPAAAVESALEPPPAPPAEPVTPAEPPA